MGSRSAPGVCCKSAWAQHPLSCEQATAREQGCSSLQTHLPKQWTTPHKCSHLRPRWRHRTAQSLRRRCPTPAASTRQWGALESCPWHDRTITHHPADLTRTCGHTVSQLFKASSLFQGLPPPPSHPLACMSQKGAAAGASVRQAPTDRSSTTDAGVSVDTRRSAAGGRSVMAGMCEGGCLSSRATLRCLVSGLAAAGGQAGGAGAAGPWAGGGH